MRPRDGNHFTLRTADRLHASRHNVYRSASHVPNLSRCKCLCFKGRRKRPAQKLLNCRKSRRHFAAARRICERSESSRPLNARTANARSSGTLREERGFPEDKQRSATQSQVFRCRDLGRGNGSPRISRHRTFWTVHRGDAADHFWPSRNRIGSTLALQSFISKRLSIMIVVSGWAIASREA